MMITGEKLLAAAFFIPHRDRAVTLDELATTAGCEPYPAPPRVDGLRVGRWAGLSARFRLISLPYHWVLVVYFLESEFHGIRVDDLSNDEFDRRRGADVPLDQDGSRILAFAFRDACNRLAPDAAFIVTHLWQAELQHLLGIEWMVLGHDGNSLVSEGFGLLYLGPEAKANLSLHLPEPDRETMPVERGCLIFAGRGWNRWW
jgi:hypothetical protein